MGCLTGCAIFLIMVPGPLRTIGIYMLIAAAIWYCVAELDKKAEQKKKDEERRRRSKARKRELKRLRDALDQASSGPLADSHAAGRRPAGDAAPGPGGGSAPPPAAHTSGRSPTRSDDSPHLPWTSGSDSPADSGAGSHGSAHHSGGHHSSPGHHSSGHHSDGGGHHSGGHHSDGGGHHSGGFDSGGSFDGGSSFF